ncbi:adventurous gliding motility protein AgmC [Archangium lansingense]|uniref:Ig-like domain-containing protein n=1 Tax=Archangium lansingense TaxID=2995310 RepID=A0ABT4AL25_9BACT|nr:Ig-like domain-containing protein [Archangium lansinium]MCY1081549.1 Ig-like domain-containing protein [Archangium lansinium]
MRHAYTRALLLLALLTTGVAVAEPDTFGLGTSRDSDFNAGTSSIVNAYARVTTPLAPGDLEISIDSVRPGSVSGRDTNANAFQAGDLVMVLQTTGAVPTIPTGLTTMVDLEAYGVGKWEFARLKAPTDSSKLTLTAPLVHGYPVYVTQVIRVPEYNDVSVGNNKAITARPWDGKTGGVLAFLADGNVTVTGTDSNAGTINADGQGFRGGAYKPDLDDTSGCTNNSGPSPAYAQKGEGVDSTRYTAEGTGDLGSNEGAGRGNFANGGGGGICSVSGGGGGGGNAANGGRGGPASTTGGMGGVPLVYSLVDRLTFGGGGGSGHGPRLDLSQSDGGKGGGIVFIRALTLTVDDENAISASGNKGDSGGTRVLPSTRADGGGGGGAGGTIVVRLRDALNCNNETVISARGGAGGTADSNANPIPGAGGGGGGGRVLYQVGTTVVSSVEKCSNAIATTSGAIGGVPNGSAGGAGFISSLPGPFPTLLAPTLDAMAAYTNQRRPTIQGGLSNTAYAGRQVVIYQGHLEVGRTYADATGRFSFKMPQNLVDGQYSIAAAFAYQGVQSPKSQPQTFTVDGTIPAQPLVDLLAARAAEANMLIGKPDLETGTDKLYISGRSEPGSTVTVQQTGPNAFSDSVSGTADGLGKWRVSIAQTAIVETVNATLTVTAVDRANNASPGPATTLTFRLDTQLPAAPALLTVGGETPGGAVPVNSLRPVLEGSADSGNRVELTLTRTGGSPEAPQTLQTISVAGRWKAAPPVDLTHNATYTVTMKAIDAAGNEKSNDLPSPTFTVDAEKPAPPVFGKLGITPGRDASPGMLIGKPDLDPSTRQLAIRGTAESGSRVTVRQLDSAGVEVSATTVTANGGAWQVDFAQTLDVAGATFTLEVKAEDAAHNVSAATTLGFKLDTQNPQPPTSITVAGVTPYANCTVTPTNYVKVNQPLIQGMAEARGTVSVTLNPVVSIPSTVVNGQSGPGSWSVSPTSSSLDDRAYELTVKVKDEAGNESEAATSCFFVDANRPDKPGFVSIVVGATTTPAVSGMLIGRPLLSAVSDTPAPNGTLSISGTAVGAKLHLNLIPQNPAVSEVPTTLTLTSGTWSSAWPGLVSGKYALEARVEDAAGHKSDPATFYFELDLIPPTITFTKTPDGLTASKDYVFGFQPSEAVKPLSSYRCSLKEKDGPTTAFPNCSNPFFGAVTRSGEYTLQVWATDLAGNETDNAAAPTYTWRVDDNQPLGKILNWDTGLLGKDRLPVATGGGTSLDEVTFVLQADKDNMKIGCKREGQEWEEPCCPDAELITNPAPATPERPICIKTYPALAEGDHVFTVKAYSRDLGIETPESSRVEYKWFVDQQAPITLITTQLNSWISTDYVQVNFVTPNEPKGVDRFDCELNGETFTTENNFVVVNFPREGGDKPYTLKIRAIDKAGIPEVTPVQLSWTVDRQDPATPGVELPTEGGRYKDLTLKGTAAGEGFSTISAYLDDDVLTPVGTAVAADNANGDWQLVIPAERKPKDGPHFVRLKVTDRAGNTGELSGQINFVMDNEPPGVTIQGPDKNSASRSATFNLTSNEEGVTFKCKLDVQGEPTDCGPQLSVSDLEEGPHTLNVYAVDIAGNRTETSFSWSVYLGRDIRAEGGGLGCSTSKGSPTLWLLGLLGILGKAVSRRRGMAGSRQ